MKRSKRYWAVVVLLVSSIAMTAMYSTNSFPGRGQGVERYLVDSDTFLRFAHAETDQPQRNMVVGVQPIVENPPQNTSLSKKKNKRYPLKRTVKPTSASAAKKLKPNNPKNDAKPEKPKFPVRVKKPGKLKPPTKDKNSDTKLNYIITNKEICAKNLPVMLVCVHTATTNFRKREMIRKTWGNVTRFLPSKVVVVFVLAVTHNSEVQAQLLNEQKKYGDLIQDGSFVDAYRNLTYKSQSMLRWADAYCSDIKLLFKVDDDSFLIPARVSKWLQKIERNNTWPTRSVIGTIWVNHGTDRTGKWKTPKEDWPGDIYTKRGCPGSGYMLTGDAIPDLVKAISKVRFLWLEDLYVTGVLGGEAGLDYISNADHHKLHFRRNEAQYYKEHLSTDVFLFGHMPTIDDVQKFWNRVVNFPV